jgi:ribonuclease BN (tRNA processing enzyme)
MEITLLGTGTAIPARQHSPAGLVVSVDDRHLLLDIGPGTLSRLEAAGISWQQLDHLLLTHLHPDHVLDLATLLLVFNYAPGAARTTPFTIIGCHGVEDFLTRLYALFPELKPIGYEIYLQPVLRDELSLENIKIRTAPSGHTPESVAFRLEADGRTLVYSGDASPDGELASLAARADLLVSECSFPAGWETTDHLNADTLGVLAQKAGVRKLLVTHCYPPAREVNLVAQIKAHYSGQVHLAVDGERHAVD